MNKTVKIVLLVLMLLALVVLVPSPALMEEWAADMTQVTPIAMDAQAGPKPLAQGYTDWGYQDGTISLSISTDRYCDTPIYIARVRIAHPSQLRTMMAGRYGTQRTALVTTLAQRGNAVFAINGDYYSYISTGLVVRQGQMYRWREDEELDALIIDTQGNLHAVCGLDKETLEKTKETFGGAANDGGSILHALTFGPALIVDGERAHETYTRPDGGEGKRAQRMVIAQDGPLSYVIVCCEGPDNTDSKGLTLEEMAQYMMTLDVDVAYNLDGGGSTSMIFKGEKINALSTSKNRSVSDILYFCTAVAQ